MATFSRRAIDTFLQLLRKLMAKVIEPRPQSPVLEHHRRCQDNRPSLLSQFINQCLSFLGNYFLETVPYTKRRHFVPWPKWTQPVDEVFEEMKREEFGGKILPETHPHTLRVRTITRVLIDALQRKVRHDPEQRATVELLEGLIWEVVVVNDPIVQAACLESGKIIVYKGMLEAMTTNSEIATCIGHEVGHIVARHTVEKATHKWWLILVYNLFYDFLKGRLLDKFLDFYSSIENLPLSRMLELEADHIGMLLMASAGYDPREAPKFFVKLGNLDGDFDENEELRSTHPSSRRRAALLAQPRLMNEALAIYKEACTSKPWIVRNAFISLLSRFLVYTLAFAKRIFGNVRRMCFRV